MARPVIILGAGGRDFHTFNTIYREDAAFKVVAFTANQIPNIDSRRYPPSLAGALYPEGIPIEPQSALEGLIRGAQAQGEVALVVFAYSDVTLEYVQQMRELVQGCGAEFATFDPEASMLRSSKPVVAICAARTGCGKSAVARSVAASLRAAGHTVAVLRHPMPYGNLQSQTVQRFAELDDLARHECTIEEMEEYEPHICAGQVLFAGVDYRAILDAAEAEADVIIWDGGNNDTSFIAADVYVTLLDPHRAGDETRYFPSMFNLQRADVLLLAKTDTAPEAGMATARASCAEHNPDARVMLGASPFALADPALVAGRRVLVVEDGPTTTHGGMGYGAGLLAARAAGAAEVVDPRPFAQGEVAAAFAKFPHLRDILPALGYGAQQLADLAATIDACECDVVVVGTPIDLARVVQISKPTVRVTYDFADAGEGLGLAEEVLGRLDLA